MDQLIVLKRVKRTQRMWKGGQVWEDNKLGGVKAEKEKQSNY